MRAVSVDWGTTSLRIRALDGGGRVVQERAGQSGILNCGGTAFAAVLHEELSALLGGAVPGAAGRGGPMPVVMSGMIGSRQGWQEAAYLRCPAAPGDIAGRLTKIDTAEGPLAGFDVRIVPGMDAIGPEGGPDVIRGEETQVFGAMLVNDIADGAFVIPGTHSKWIEVAGGRIAAFRTYMTGEVFAALLDHTILGRLAGGRDHDADAFCSGVAQARQGHLRHAGPGGLLNLIFSARTRGLMGELGPDQVASYLSGLLIGSELMEHAAAAAGGDETPATDTAWLIGEGDLVELYLEAGRICGLALEAVRGDIVAVAHWAIAQQAGMLGRS